MSAAPAYAELHCLSNYSFLRGASKPHDLVGRAFELGYTALAITDECSLAGVVRAHVATKECKLKLLIGAEFGMSHGFRLVMLATHRKAYGRLSQLITLARRRTEKGSYRVDWRDFENSLDGCIALLIPPPILADWDIACGRAEWLRRNFGDDAWIGVELLRGSDDRAQLADLQDLGDVTGVPLVAAGDVHMHMRSRRMLQDTLTAIRHGTTVAAAGNRLFPNGERHLRELERLAGIYPTELLAATLKIAARCQFSLDELKYEYPQELVPSGQTPTYYLRYLTEAGFRWRFDEAFNPGSNIEPLYTHKGNSGSAQGSGALRTLQQIRALIEVELTLIADLSYEKFFLTVHDIVRYARSKDILCQGRGSAANSAVCYCLGVTEVSPMYVDVLFARFLSKARNEPPDIDVDFEHQNREVVIQYIYEKYGRDRTALTATVISYRRRSAVRDIGKALGLAPAQIDQLAGSLAWWDKRADMCERLREAGLDSASPQISRLIELVDAVLGFPRHLSQHTGGFVISGEPLLQLVPIENAAMKDRSVIQWDKDDIEALGLLKVDVLALGMLSVIQRALKMISAWHGKPFTMTEVPQEDPAVYEMIQRADTIGVFQIESRAQMSMLPRLKPEKFYDLVIEIAIVRPGPIQGDMVHPYLRRKQKLEKVTYPGKEVKAILERTLGVPIFQEQVMQIAIEAAGFSSEKADALRRAMAAWKHDGHLEKFKEDLVAGLKAKKYSLEFANQLCKQMEGFSSYGFPESHSVSFAVLAYVSSWIKYHEPAIFLAALLNSQPMGFYAPSQLVQDARRHGVEVRAVDVLFSNWECTLENGADDKPAVRLGSRMAGGFSEKAAHRLIVAREQRPFDSVNDLAVRADLDKKELKSLAAAGALAALSGHRHNAHWQVAGVEKMNPLLESAHVIEAAPRLVAPTEGQNLVADYASIGLTLGRHPLALLRDRLKTLRLSTAAELSKFPHGHLARTAGIVTGRQRPGTASGVVFVTLEDETGNINVVVWNRLVEKQRRELLGSRLLGVYGVLEREGEVAHLIAQRLVDYSALLGRLETTSRDFH